MRKVFIIGGGAAGFFSAINIAKLNPDHEVVILEKSTTVLGKVKVSGGGRCNVTHACFDPKELVNFYPRGAKELLGPFHSFQPGDTIEWFSNEGIELKIEEDGRMFPVTDDSATIVDCFVSLAKKHNILISLKSGVKEILKEGDKWKLVTENTDYLADDVAVSAGSSNAIWKLISGLDLKVIPPVPSLFTFNIKHSSLHQLAGISFENAEVSIPKLKSTESGQLLVTHWGLSGPAVLKLSSRKAIELHEADYEFEIEVNYLPAFSAEELDSKLMDCQNESSKVISNHNPFKLPKRFWNYILSSANAEPDRKWSDLRKDERISISRLLNRFPYSVQGKSTFKEEFVTAGGLDLKEVSFKTMESKKHPGLYFSGEVLNIDALTGGFNFQAAWTTAYIAALAISKKD